jgi:NAD(P)H dehydrogenase (quinone)
MTKVLVLYYSAYGHMETLAYAVAEGARSTGAEVDVKRVPETVSEEVIQRAHIKTDQKAPIATIEDLKNYDAIIVGAGTRYGRLVSQMGAFWDGAGAIWASGALSGKVGSAFSGSATQHGGMVIVGLPYDWGGQRRDDEITGGTPYGITTITGQTRAVSDNELDGARYQGRHVAEVAAKLLG